MTISNYLEDAILNHVFRTSTYSQPSTVAVALCTSGPSDSSTGSTIAEVSNSNSYARVDLGAPANADWTLNSGTNITSAADITFPTASGSWGTITHIALVDSATHGAGNLLWYGALSASKTVGSGDTFKITAGNLTLALD